MADDLQTGTDSTQTGTQPGGTSQGEGKPADGKPADGKPADGKPVEGAPADGKPAEGAPADGKPAEGTNVELKVPEGLALGQEHLAELQSVVNDAALTPQARTQKLLDLAAKAGLDAHAARKTAWVEEVKADPILGGPKLEETLAIARKTVALGPPELKAVLDQSGFGNHIAFIRWAHAIGKTLSEDRFVPGGQNPNTPKGSSEEAKAERLYGKTTTA
jgi:hypothetical protein